MEDEPDERDATDWLVDDETPRHLGDVSKEKEKIAVKTNEDKELRAGRVQSVPELVVTRAEMR